MEITDHDSLELWCEKTWPTIRKKSVLDCDTVGTNDLGYQVTRWNLDGVYIVGEARGKSKWKFSWKSGRAGEESPALTPWFYKVLTKLRKTVVLAPCTPANMDNKTERTVRETSATAVCDDAETTANRTSWVEYHDGEYRFFQENL